MWSLLRDGLGVRNYRTAFRLRGGKPAFLTFEVLYLSSDIPLHLRTHHLKAITSRHVKKEPQFKLALNKNKVKMDKFLEILDKYKDILDENL